MFPIADRWISSVARAALLVAGACSPVFAQTDAQEGTLTEIVVTAQKREQSLNTVPITITAADADTLAIRGINSLADLPSLVPGFTIQESQFNSTSFTLRGVGFFNTDLATPPAVTVYVDEAPLPYPAMTTLAAFDLERVEVLKGPQGTLFGQNATGGLVNYIAAKPTEQFQAGVDASYGRFNRVTLAGFLSGPLNDAISIRFAVQGRRGDPWQYSVTRPDERMGRIEELQSRMTIDIHPNDQFKSRITFTMTHDGSQAQAAQSIGNALINPALAPPGFINFPIVYSPRAADWPTVRDDYKTPFPYGNDINLYQLTWRNDYELTDKVTLTSLTSYSRFTEQYAEAPDGVPYHINEIIDDAGKINSLFQEFRISGKADRYNWLLGANYENDKLNDQPLIFFRDKDICSIFSAPTSQGGLGLNPDAYCDEGQLSGQTKVDTYAVFGRAEYNLTNSLSLEAGARYNIDRRDFSNCAYTVTQHFADFWNIFRGFAAPLTQVGDCYVLNSAANNTPLPNNVFKANLDANTFSWRIGPNWTIQPGTMVYANVSKGFKAGIVPVVGAATTNELKPVPTESLLAYEGGIKTELLDRRLQVNGAIFYYDYKDKQLRGSLLDPAFGALEALVSIPKSHADGAEAQVTVNPIKGLVVDTALTFVQTKIDDFTGYDAFANERNLAGTAFPFSPKWQSVSNVDYKFPIGGGLNAFAGTTLTYDSGTFAGVGGGDAYYHGGGRNAGPGVLRVDPYGLLDLRAGIEPDGGRFRVWLWGKNVTDKYYWTNVLPYQNAISRYTGQPMTFGISGSYRFGE